MSELIAYVLIGFYIYLGKPELIIAAGLFAIGAEVNTLVDKLTGRCRA